MPKPFAITAASNSVFLDKDRHGKTSLTVSNQSGRSIRGQARLIAEDTEAKKWIKLRGQAHRDFAIAGTEQYVVEIDVPPDAPGGNYTLRLDMVGEERPDEQYVEGPAVTFQVPEPETGPTPFPWIVAAVVAVLIIGGSVLAWALLNDDVSVNASFTVDPEAPIVGDEVRLDATESTVAGASDLAYSWSLSAPEQSAATIDDPQAASTSFTADTPGDYRIELEISANGASDNTAISVGIESAFELPAVYLTDGGDATGKIYRMNDGQLQTIYERPSGRIYSVAVAPDGEIYFSDHNDNHIYVLQSGDETRVYTHSTYTRDIDFDHQGRVHFSESSGAGEDGQVYALDLETGTAESVFAVRLSDVDGFWAGNFAFAPDGSLWLSSGNRVPASIYKVEGIRPQRMFTSSDSSIRGVTFTAEGYLLYTDGRQRVFRVEPPDFAEAKVLHHVPEFQWATDVAIADN